MKVLTIVSHDDCNTGNVTAVLEIPEGMNEDELFVKWLRQNSYYYRDKPHLKCMEAEYVWNVCETERI